MTIKKFLWVASSDDVALVNSSKTFRGKVGPGAQLEVYAVIPGTRVQTLRADASGRYEVDLPPGTYFVNVTQPSDVQIDAAVARPQQPGSLDDSIIGIGSVRGTTAPDVGLNVQKSGRSTGLTRGQITVVGTTVTIGFSQGRSARFTNQIVSTKMGGPGDSGSLLVDFDNRVVGLLFAGGLTATIYHPIGDVLDLLDIRLSKEKPEWPLLHYSLGRYRYLQQITQSRSQDLLKLPNVVGVGIGHKHQRGFNIGEPCITVLVTKKVPNVTLPETDIIPTDIDGVMTDVIETGPLTAETEVLPSLKRYDHTVKLRPARPGISIGHYQVSAGTFGAVVYDNQTDEPLILSNNHVLANATSSYDGLAKIGDPILQPGQADGGLEPEDVIGNLLRFHPIIFG